MGQKKLNKFGKINLKTCPNLKELLLKKMSKKSMHWLETCPLRLRIQYLHAITKATNSKYFRNTEIDAELFWSIFKMKKIIN